MSHTALSVRHAAFDRPDIAFVFNAVNAPLLPFLRLRRIPVATHVDGLEWKRAKWNGAGQRYYRAAEALAVRWSDALIADAAGIQEYYSDRFSVSADYIPYGAPILGDAGAERIAELGLTARGHHLVVARFEPENHVNLAVDGYLRSAAGWPLIVVGATPYADRYTAKINELAAADRRVRSALFRVGPAAAESALWQRADLHPRAFGRWYQSVAASGDGRRNRDRRLRCQLSLNPWIGWLVDHGLGWRWS